jgi:Haem-binding domain
MKRKVLSSLLALLVIIQVIRPARNISATTSANDISKHFTVPADVQSILQRSCNDCHSNNTVYPWYPNIQPVGWWLQRHVDDGKADLNFSEFAAYTTKRQAHKMEEVVDEVKNGGMPLNTYLWMHGNAKLSEADKQLLIQWAEKVKSEVGTTHN